MGELSKPALTVGLVLARQASLYIKRARCGTEVAGFGFTNRSPEGACLLTSSGIFRVWVKTSNGQSRFFFIVLYIMDKI